MQFIISGSKRFRKNGGPHLKRVHEGLGRKLLGLCSLGGLKSYFSAPKRKKIVFYFIFSAPSRYGVRRPNNFFDPPQKHFGPHIFFSAAFFLFRRPKPKIGFFGGRLRSNIFRKNLGFFFFRRRLVMVFGGQITFSTPQKYFRRPKPKIGFFGGRRRNKKLHSGFTRHTSLWR